MGIVLERFHGWWVLSRHELNETGRSRSAFDLDDRTVKLTGNFSNSTQKSPNSAQNMQVVSWEQGINSEFPLPTRMNTGDLSLHFS
jgi:hypothetical protein